MTVLSRLTKIFQNVSFEQMSKVQFKFYEISCMLIIYIERDTRNFYSMEFLFRSVPMDKVFDSLKDETFTSTISSFYMLYIPE